MGTAQSSCTGLLAESSVEAGEMEAGKRYVYFPCDIASQPLYCFRRALVSFHDA